MKFAQKLAMMMYGRNGNDNLNKFIMIITVILTVVNIFIQHFIVSIVMSSVILSLLALYTWRALSKNIFARRKENAVFMKFWGPVSNLLKLTKNKFKDRKTHVYKKCPKCKAVLRLPKKKGNHTVVCPKCRNRFDVKI